MMMIDIHEKESLKNQSIGNLGKRLVVKDGRKMSSNSYPL